MAVTTTIVTTSHGEIAVAQSSGKGMPVLFIHGNSSSKEAFRKQYDSPLGEVYRMIAMDLPGHGQSSDAFDPARTYSMPGYAAVAGEVLDALGVDRATIVGWSLGGHVAMEMLSSWPGVVGVMLCAAPPVTPDAGRHPGRLQAQSARSASRQGNAFRRRDQGASQGGSTARTSPTSWRGPCAARTAGRGR